MKSSKTRCIVSHLRRYKTDILIMPLSLKERPVLGLCRESNVLEQMRVVQKKPKRLADFLGEANEMNNTKASLSSPPLSPRFLSRWFSSLRARRDTQLLRIRFNVCSSVELDSKDLVRKGKRDCGAGLVENGAIADIDGAEDGSQRLRDTKNSMVSLTQVAPDNAVSDCDLREAGGRKRKSCKNMFMRSSRKREELVCQSLVASSDAKGKNELLTSAGDDLFSAQPISQDSKINSIDITTPGRSSYLKASSPNLPITCLKQSETVTPSGNHLGEMSFNFGVGIGLFFLIAKSKNELDKIAELRSQMEMLVKDIRNEMQKKDKFSNLSVTNSNTVCSSSASQGVQSRSLCNACGNHTSTDSLVEMHSSVESDQFYNSVTTSMSTITTSNGTILAFESAQCQGMDQLEAELEVELERLQLNLDMENTSKMGNCQRIEMILASSDPDKSLDATLREESGDGEEGKYGISAHELERRLHELLETRQEERISELECALEEAERMLREKEMEINRWKDEAQLIQQNLL